MLIFVLFLVGELKICFFQTTTLGFSDKEVVKEGDTCLLSRYHFIEYYGAMKGYILFVFTFLLLFSARGEEPGQKELLKKEVDEYIRRAHQSTYADPVKAVSYSNTAILKAELSGDANLICLSLLALGGSYINLGSFDMGFEAFYNALDKCPADNKGLLAEIHVNISYLYISLGDVKKAFQFVDKGLEYFWELQDSSGIARCYNAKGLAYERSENNPKAEECFKYALKINRELNDSKNVAANLNNLGLLEENPDEKIKWLEEAVQINRSLGANWSLAENYNNLATQYFNKRDYNKALEWLQNAFILANNLSAKELICDNYRYQTWVYNALGNYKKAYECMQSLYEIEKVMLSERKIREIELNVADRRFKSQQQELNLKQKELKIKGLQRDMSVMLAIGLGILLCLSFVVWRVRQRRKLILLEATQKIEAQQKEMMQLQLEKTEKERENVQIELEHSKKELTNFACYVRSKNELIEKIKSMIKESYKEAKPDVKAQLKTINAFITQYQNKEDNLGSLITEIDRINAEFVVRLTEAHPDLSKNEKQLASLLRIDFTTKEIALLVGSTPKTVNMARYRLRKKLGLETDEGLNEYMKKM